jgi:diacylglycerol kinase family enzyme
MRTRSLLVVNPSATSTTPRARDVLIAALSRYLDVEVVTTQGRGHASEVAHKAAVDGMDVVIALGGDGTINEVVNGLLANAPADRPAESVPALGIVPGGSANVLARTLGVPRDPVEATGALIAAIQDQHVRTIGLGRVEDRWFTFSAGMGVDAEVVRAVEARRVAGARSTTGLWVRTAARSVLFHTDRRTPSLTVEELTGGDAMTGIFLVIVSNTAPWTYLGARPVNPNPASSFDTGLDLLGLRTLRTLPTAIAAGQMIWSSGGLTSRRAVRLTDSAGFLVTASRPVACQVDGDYVGALDRAEFRSVPAALNVLVPALDVPSDM